MAVSGIKCFVVMMLMVMFVVRHAECITPSQDFKLNKIHEPFCTIICTFLCYGNLYKTDYEACKRSCKEDTCHQQQ